MPWDTVPNIKKHFKMFFQVIMSYALKGIGRNHLENTCRRQFLSSWFEIKAESPYLSRLSMNFGKTISIATGCNDALSW